MGTLLLPGIGTFIGLLVGGWLGQKAGGVIAPLVWVEEETAEVVVGTNAADIIRQGQQMMRDQAISQSSRSSVSQTRPSRPLVEEIEQLKTQVKEWPLTLEK